jgi:hypothetical protein
VNYLPASVRTSWSVTQPSTRLHDGGLSTATALQLLTQSRMSEVQSTGHASDVAMMSIGRQWREWQQHNFCQFNGLSSAGGGIGCHTQLLHSLPAVPAARSVLDDSNRHATAHTHCCVLVTADASAERLVLTLCPLFAAYGLQLAHLHFPHPAPHVWVN